MWLLAKGKYEDIQGVEAVWQAPPPNITRRGVLFIAHGCNHGAIDWWPRSDSCPQCIGLPEEMNVTLHALLRGYAVVAVSSAARRGSRCWQTVFGGGSDYVEAQGSDIQRVKLVLDTVLPRAGLQSLPLFALGASSGGAFVLGLPLLLPGRFAGLAVQISAGPPGLLQRYKSLSDASPGPPTLFAHMPRDSRLAALVALDLAELRRGGVPTKEIQLLPRPLTPLYLAQRCAPEVDEQASRAIHKALRDSDYLDERGFLRRDPRDRQDGGWRAILRQEGVPGLGDKIRLQPEASPVAEELNLLFAGHELSSETTTDMLDWFEQNTSGDMERARGAGAGSGQGGEGGGPQRVAAAA